jgi:hypothetical protein
MKRSALISSSLIASLSLALVAPAAMAVDMLQYSFANYDRLSRAVATRDGHKPIVYTEDRAPVYVLTRIVVEGTSAEDWDEAMEILNTMRHDEPPTVADWYQRFHEHGDASCKSEWTVLGQSESSLTFERKSGECPPHASQQAIYKVMYGKKQVFLLIGTRKGTMDEATRAGWLAVMESASVVPSSALPKSAKPLGNP